MKNIIGFLFLITGYWIGWCAKDYKKSLEHSVIMQSLYNTDAELNDCNEWVRFLEDDTEQGKRIGFLEFEIEQCVSHKRNYDKWLENQKNNTQKQ